jgi:hypothetical protein
MHEGGCRSLGAAGGFRIRELLLDPHRRRRVIITPCRSWRNECATVTSGEGKRSAHDAEPPEYPPTGDAAHSIHVSRIKLGLVAYRFARQRVRNRYLLQPSLKSRLLGEGQKHTTDVRWCLRKGAPIRQTSRKAGTQSHEATAPVIAPRQSSRRTVHWRSTDASDASARLCRRHVFTDRVHRERLNACRLHRTRE